MTWKNKIVGTGVVAPSSLTPNNRNARRHPPHQRRALLSAIDSVGVIQDVIVNQRTGKLVDGHLRLELALDQGQDEIPVKYVDLTEAEEALVLATFDPVGSLAFLDLDEMGSLRDELAPTLDRPLADLIDTLAPAPIPALDPPSLDDDPAPDDHDDGHPAGDAEPLPESTGHFLSVAGRRVPMSQEEAVRLTEAFEAYQESRGMAFGFARWLAT